MAWEQRGDRTYFYRSVRVGTRVIKEYAGGGLAGILADEFDAEQREARQQAEARRRQQRARWADLDREAAALGMFADVLSTAALVEAGYHRHDRGEWRRRRE